MHLQDLLPNDPVVIELGVADADVAVGLREAGYKKYLGVGNDEKLIRSLQAKRPDLAEQLTSSRRHKLVLNNNAELLVLTGQTALHLWKYRSVRHASWVAWRAGFNLWSLLAWIGCVVQLVSKRYSRPQIVTLSLPDGRTTKLFVSRILRPRDCHKCRHFIPHVPGLTGMFRAFDGQGVRYAVLRWFEDLPKIEPDEDVDMLVADESLDKVIKYFSSLPGILPCDLYSASGLARSSYCGTPYYPPHVANRILDGAVRHNDLCLVPSPSHYFHSLAYHACYHKGAQSHLSSRLAPRDGVNSHEASKSQPLPPILLKPRGKPEHDYTGILRAMAAKLGIQVEISLQGLHEYLQRTGWGPSPEMLVRLAEVCKSNRWLQLLATKQARHLCDEGLAVFVIRRESVRRGFQQQIVQMIEQGGFEILTTHELSPAEIDFAAARSRGGNWEAGEPFTIAAGPPAIAVVAYDREPLPLNRRQRRKFTHRTNARIFVKEAIRDAIIAQLPKGESFNALHSSDNAAEAWHLIEILAPRRMDEVRRRMEAIYAGETMTIKLSARPNVVGTLRVPQQPSRDARRHPFS